MDKVTHFLDEPKVTRKSGDMFWYMFTGTHYHVHCQLAPEDADGRTDKVVQVFIVPEDEYNGETMEPTIQKFVGQLNRAARFWAHNRWNQAPMVE